MILLVSLLCSGTPAQSADKVCFEEPQAKALLIDIQDYKQNTPLLKEMIQSQEIKINGLTLDKIEYRKEADQYKDIAIKQTNRANKAEQDKPSRFTWWSIGAITSAVVLIASIVLVK